MLKLLQKIFAKKEEIRTKTLNLEEFNPWFSEEISNLPFKTYLQEYFTKLKDIKSKLQETVKKLENKGISDKDLKQVEPKVINIVKGQRDNYVKEIKQFMDKIIEINSINTITDYQKALELVSKLNEDLQNLAQRSNKSYQASQHLFFQETEDIFKILGELNILAKESIKRIAESKIGQLPEIITLTEQLQQATEKKSNIKLTMEDKKLELPKSKESKQETINKLNNLKLSQDYQYYQELQNKNEILQKERKEMDDKVYSYFTKLQKAFKKYERIAIDNKPILPYLKDVTKTFYADKDLKIVEILQGLKRNLNSLLFDERQKTIFLNLIEKSEQKYLQKLQEQNKKLLIKEIELNKQIKQLTILDTIKEVETEITKLDNHEKDLIQEITHLNDSFNKNNPEQIQQNLQQLVKEILKVEVTFISS
jgi:hypothetical protein